MGLRTTFDGLADGVQAHKADHLALHQRYNATRRVGDYGAVGDGVTDDTAAIRAALDADGAVRFDSGTYVVSGLSTRGDKRIEGNGATLKLADGSDTTLLHLMDGNISVSGLALNGNKANQGIGHYDGLRLTRCTGEVRDVVATDTPGIGVRLCDCYDVLLDHMRTARCGVSGETQVGFGILVSYVYPDGVGSKRVKLVGCSDEASGYDVEGDNEGGGLFLDSTTSECQVVGYHSLSSNKYGVKAQGNRHVLSNIVVNGASYCAVAPQGNEISLNGLTAIDCGYGIRVTHFTNFPDRRAVSLNNIHIERPSYWGIEIHNLVEAGPMMDVQLDNFRIYDGLQRGLRLRGGIADVQVSNGIIAGCAETGITAEPAPETSAEPTRVSLAGVTSRGNDLGFDMRYGAGKLIDCQSVDNVNADTIDEAWIQHA